MGTLHTLAGLAIAAPILYLAYRISLRRAR